MMLRIASGVAAVLIFVLSAAATLGLALAAPFGIFVGNRIARRKSRPFTRWSSWLSASAATSIVLVVGLAVLLASLPAGTWDEIHTAALKAQAEDAARGGPAWMRPDPATEKIVTSRSFTTVFGIVGLVMGGAVLGVIAATPGWIATLLLGYAVHGRQPTPPLPQPPKPKPPEPWEPARVPRDPPPPKPPGQ